ncbi:histidinol dehydrogenase [Pseudidiomarina tainanensis]|uniref:Histidinol dehydrogenase n=1 Tax=Pseudidiomarina tainanensis TaxID=502365 RepID=A0ACD2HJI0_9GAMM|nr:histidinol dehydrogenase [Pseudidiomarina tainanensis]RZQ56561.1 histidinol dehydrogenase [Pseudidiomarina tainanensis]
MRAFQWSQLTDQQQAEILARPAQSQSAELQQQVAAIIDAVANEGDAAVLRYTRQFDCENLSKLRYSEAKIAERAEQLSADIKQAIDTAYETIRTFHLQQQPQDISVETAPGVVCTQRFEALTAVGLYIPGGTAVLPSTALMLGVPAQIANNPRRVLVSPPDSNGELSPALMYVAQKCGITEVYCCGGAQAIAALALGTESIAPVAKIFGPGNSYVTAAKQQVAQRSGGPAIDMPAGPSELLVIADDTANPAFVAADLLSQAEHGADSQVILVSPSAALISATQSALEQQLEVLPRAATARKALEQSSLIQADSLEQACEISQRYAPEHLSVQLDDAEQYLAQLSLAGSIFVGHYTPESGGDYATGTNHVLPTYGFARNYSSLGLLDFYRRYTTQTVTKQGLAQLSKAIITLAETEGLRAHARAVSIRLENQS